MKDDYRYLSEEFHNMKTDFSVCIKELSEAIRLLKEIQSCGDMNQEIMGKIDGFIEKASRKK